MLIVYYSLTGNVRRFVEKTGRPAQEITLEKYVTEPFIIVTPTNGFGEVPPAVGKFLRINGALLRGVTASGNRNWGANYSRAADRICEKYNVPILHRFELAGTDEDVRKFNEEVTRLDAIYRTQ
ncbi:class Ib ribonucleoside-diphosphate reductase assembly flavoprotein NrdI [Paenibacillus sp. YIM B09110]|uniref:class Ib ribonucleoside-diphosphate reductase assembly flavoprotein NrdI n=1 Tax=Paenibacillus sp. YIM B09110 TaxID=3126102 RepID=UPI00301D38D9